MTRPGSADGMFVRRTVQHVVIAIVVLHGIIHLLGAAKGLGWAGVSALKQPIGPVTGVAWLVAAILVVAAGALLAGGVTGWWVVGVLAVVASQSVILTSWADARAGTVVNVILLAAVIHNCAARGPRSYRAEFRRRANTAIMATDTASGVISETDLDVLPLPVAAYVRRSGAVGQPRVFNFRAHLHGRIRATAETAWMPFTGEQVNTYGSEPTRLFIMDACRSGLPVDVLHVYVGASATMRVKLLSLLPLVNAAGPDMDRGETVTMFNDLCLLAPAALLDAPVTWQPIDADHVRGSFTNGRHTVGAELTFNSDHELVDFMSDDRLRASQDGKTATLQRWSTPVAGYRAAGSRRTFTTGYGRWYAPAPEGEFAYLELVLDDITYNATPASNPQRHDFEHPSPQDAVVMTA